MSYSEIDKRETKPQKWLETQLDTPELRAIQLVEHLTELARAIADDEIDRLFNRGDYRS